MAKRVGIAVDMTPMVDVGFLLLTFFMLTTQFKPDEAAQVTLPESHSVIKLPDVDVAIVLIAKGGEVYLGFDSQIMRAYIFGVKNSMKAGMEVTVRELGGLLTRARMKNPKLRTVIKSDKDAEFGVIEDVMKVLQEVNVTRFNLVTNEEKS